MTGVGSARGDTEFGRTLIELRAVNGRGLSIKHRLPSTLAGLEPMLERAIGGRVRRGTVTCIVEAQPIDTTRRVNIDREALIEAVRELRSIATAAGLSDRIELRDVLAVPGVIAAPTDAPRAAREPSPEFQALAERAVAALMGEREREGAATLEYVTGLVADFVVARDRVARRAPEVFADYRSKLLARVNEVLADQAKPLTPADVIREVALYADRVDITEELQRITAHVGRVRELLAAGGEIGRTLEFLLQELLREVNTVGSKSQDVEIAHDVVSMKASVDKLRELVANLE